MVLAAEVIEEFPVRGDPQGMKERLIARHCGEHAELRDRFIAQLAAWLSELTAET